MAEMGIHHLLDKKDMGWSLYGVKPQCILSLPSTPFSSPKIFIFLKNTTKFLMTGKLSLRTIIYMHWSFNKQPQNTRTVVHIIKMKLSDRWCNSPHCPVCVQLCKLLPILFGGWWCWSSNDTSTSIQALYKGIVFEIILDWHVWNSRSSSYTGSTKIHPTTCCLATQISKICIFM